MRHVAPALGQAPGDRLAHVVERDEIVRPVRDAHLFQRGEFAGDLRGWRGGRSAATGLASAPSTSRRMIRPCGPEPLIAERSRPFCFAMRLASGDATTRVSEAGASSRSAGVPPASSFGAACGSTAGASLFGGVAGRDARATRRPNLALPEQPRDGCVDLHVFRAFSDQDGVDDAFVDGLDLHGRLVGLDLGDDVAGLHRIAGLDQPFGERALLHGRRQRRHEDVGHAGSFRQGGRGWRRGLPTRGRRSLREVERRGVVQAAPH